MSSSANKPSNSAVESTVLATIRRILFAVLVFGIVGILIELFLLEHTEGFWQQVPLYMLIAGLAVVVWHAFDRRAASVRVVQATMLLFVAGGAIGALLHYNGNVEFELEMDAASRGFDLFREAMMGATPALAPGVMIQLGLVGLAYSFRHPALASRSTASDQADG